MATLSCISGCLKEEMMDTIQLRRDLTALALVVIAMLFAGCEPGPYGYAAIDAADADPDNGIVGYYIVVWGSQIVVGLALIGYSVDLLFKDVPIKKYVMMGGEWKKLVSESRNELIGIIGIPIVALTLAWLVKPPVWWQITAVALAAMPLCSIISRNAVNKLLAAVAQLRSKK